MSTLALLQEAHTELAKLIEKKRTKEAIALLEQCQQGAIDVGTLTDSLEGEGTETVRHLEEYCELVYQFHEALQQSDSVNIWQLQKKLKKPLLKAESSLKNDIPTQREAVFLPYKASMWDSLESVWKAANEDPDCTALVIPIPYYDKNPDGSYGKLHYEIDQFPADVPVMKYEEYDFEKQHPDMIFIHNPYDDENYVTSVPAFFFSSNLKRYTDKLIYIPYFVLGEIDPANEKEVAGMEHFCTTPGVVHADCVIVESEAMRQVYVNVLTKHTNEGMRSYWEKKILGLGSPKVDRVCNLKKEDFALPVEWERLICREDGSRKKVIFYNTSVGTLLQKNEAVLEKIKDNFRIFWENRDEVVLWWRPHPLIEATLKSMRPQLLGQYQELVQRYRAEGWGIYDDSPNMDRAIAVSDGYYGDLSSVVWLYQKTGKPIMIQNVDVIN